MRKPAIPNPRPGDRFAAAVKENIEIIEGKRGGRIKRVSPAQERWQDLLCAITTRTTGAGTPQYNVFNGGPQRAFEFAVGDEVYAEVHMPHDWKPGTKLYFHVHWAGSNNNTGTVTWRAAWQYARGYGLEAFSASTSVDITQANPATAFAHNIAEMTDAQAILPVNCEPDGIFMVAAKLQSKTYTGSVFAFFLDMHYQSDDKLTTTRNIIRGPDNKYYWQKNYDVDVGDTTNKLNEIIEVMQ